MTEINVKDILMKPIPSKIANEFVKKHHYSGKVVNNSCLHFGAFYNNLLHGVLSFGPSLDKSKIIGLVKDTKWNDFLELNRMAFDDFLPRNSESRCISVCMKLIKKHYPNIQWVISFADGCQCGDGTIYRASGFVLTMIKENKDICVLPNGQKIHSMTLKSNPLTPRPELNGKTFYDITGGGSNFTKYVEAVGGEIEVGYQLRYIYFIDKSCKEKLTVPILPFSEIDKIGAGMYKGEKITQKERHEKGIAEKENKM